MLEGARTKKHLQFGPILLLLGASLFILTKPVAAQEVGGATLSVNIGSINGAVELAGYAFPGALITFLRDNVVAGTQVADNDSHFDETISGLVPATYNFSIFAQAFDGRKTLTISFAVSAQSGQTTTISGIVLPAIVSVPSSIKRTDILSESGLAQSGSTITTFTHSNGITKQTIADSQGNWNTSITETLDLGSHSASAIVSNTNGGQSVQTSPLSFTVLLSASLNRTGKVNLTDFSILMYSYGLASPPNPAADINDDGKVNLVDFSIMMFYWTG